MKWMLLASPLTLLIDCIVFVNFFMWQQQSVYEFNQRQLDLQVNYSIDAAAQEMLSDGTHIDTDYIDWGQMTIEPEVALNAYEAVLLRNLGWSDYKENREDLIESSIPFFIVATYDGYYCYGRQRDDIVTTVGSSNIHNTVYDFRWTPKIPYSRVDEDSNRGYIYYLSDKYYGSCDLTNPIATLQEELPLNDGTGFSSRQVARATIADTLTAACNSALFIGTEGNTDYLYYIPAYFSEWSNNNPVETPSILTYVSRVDQYTQYDTVTFGIGGAKIDDAEFCICYTVNGSKRYAWADDRESVEGFYGSGYKLERVVVSREAAASEGYYFDSVYYESR